MKYVKIIILTVLLILSVKSKSQISDIMDLAGGAADALSGCSSSDISAGCDAFYCCWHGGFYFVEFLFDHHQEIMDMRNLNPSVLSLEFDANTAWSFHYSPDSGQFYQYFNYLPRIRGNLGIFSTDFRYNMLIEYDLDVPTYYKSWDLIMMLNIVPSERFKLSFGSGVYSELYTGNYYNEHYINTTFGLNNNRSLLDMDCRLAIDYTNSQLPFAEAGIRYMIRIMDIPHVYSYVTLGFVYQNYYAQHDIFGGNAGLLFNIH
jgi:hypothetical protein